MEEKTMVSRATLTGTLELTQQPLRNLLGDQFKCGQCQNGTTGIKGEFENIVIEITGDGKNDSFALTVYNPDTHEIIIETKEYSPKHIDKIKAECAKIMNDNGIELKEHEEIPEYDTNYLRQLSKSVQERPDEFWLKIFPWIDVNIHPGPRYSNNTPTSDSLKRYAEKDLGMYISNDDMKLAMLMSGFTPKDEWMTNWVYRIAPTAPIIKRHKKK